MEILKKHVELIIIISIQKFKIESEAWALNAPPLLINMNYKLSIIIENTGDKTCNKMANHIVNMQRSKDILNNCCILVNCYILMK